MLRVDRVGSTNTFLAGLAREGAADGTVVVARHQTAGRGRRGRTWEAPPGSSLLVSALLREGVTGLVPLAAGMAAVDACAEAAGCEPGLKWPNDLVVDGGAKLGGILCEALDGRTVVVGLGLNLAWSSPLPPGATDLAAAAGRPVSGDAVLDAWLDRLEHRLAQPPEDLLDDYRRRCVTLGQGVRVETPSGSLTGHAWGIDSDGRLMLRGPDGREQSLAAGDVVSVRR